MPKTQHRSIPRATDNAPAVAEFATSSREVARCRVCGRTLLMGERSVGCFTDDGEGPFDVCSLCVPRAGKFGLRTRPSTPDELSTSARKQRKRIRLFRRTPRVATTPVGAAAIPVALAAFNESEHSRTLAGLQKTLGSARASVVPRSPTDREVILTVAWEIVWYQFRIMPGGIEATRGTYLSDLPSRWQQWNCTVLTSGRVAAPLEASHIEVAQLRVTDVALPEGESS